MSVGPGAGVFTVTVPEIGNVVAGETGIVVDVTMPTPRVGTLVGCTSSTFPVAVAKGVGVTTGADVAPPNAEHRGTVIPLTPAGVGVGYVAAEHIPSARAIGAWANAARSAAKYRPTKSLAFIRASGRPVPGHLQLRRP